MRLSVYSGTLRLVDGTTDDDHPKTLLAAIHTPAALLVVLTPSVYVKKETPFEFPLLTFAHKSRSFFLSLWGVGLS